MTMANQNYTVLVKVRTLVGGQQVVECTTFVADFRSGPHNAMEESVTVLQGASVDNLTDITHALAEAFGKAAAAIVKRHRKEVRGA